MRIKRKCKRENRALPTSKAAKAVVQCTSNEHVAFYLIINGADRNPPEKLIIDTLQMVHFILDNFNSTAI